MPHFSDEYQKLVQAVNFRLQLHFDVIGCPADYKNFNTASTNAAICSAQTLPSLFGLLVTYL